MEDLVSDHLPRWRLLHLPLFALLNAWAIGVALSLRSNGGRPGAPAALFVLLAVAIPSSSPVFAATLATRAHRIVPSALASATLSMLLGAFLWDPRRAWAGLLSGPLVALAGMALTSPIARLIRFALATPRARNVARESALLAFYGLLTMALCLLLPIFDARGHASRSEHAADVATLLVAAATLLAAIVGVVWELRFRIRVRAALAGEMTGWRAFPAEDLPAADATPALLWLDDLARVIVKDAPLRALVRGSEGRTAPVYREETSAGAPWLRVPARVPLLGAHMIVNAVFGACAAPVFLGALNDVVRG